MSRVHKAPGWWTFALASSVLATTPFVPNELPDGLRPAGLVVVGQVSGVVSQPVLVKSTTGGEGRGQVGSAVLEVSEVLWGDVPQGISLGVKWHESPFTKDPIELEGVEDGQRGVFFLTCPSHRMGKKFGYRCRISGKDPVNVSVWRFAPLHEKSAVIELLADYPLRWYHQPAFVTGKSVHVTLAFVNASSRPLRLPAVNYEDGVLTHAAGARLVLRGGSPKSEVPAFANALRLDTTLPEIVLRSGEERSVTMDLARLFPMDSPGFYFVDLELDRFPAQLQDALIVIRSDNGEE